MRFVGCTAGSYTLAKGVNNIHSLKVSKIKNVLIMDKACNEECGDNL